MAIQVRKNSINKSIRVMKNLDYFGTSRLPAVEKNPCIEKMVSNTRMSLS